MTNIYSLKVIYVFTEVRYDEQTKAIQRIRKKLENKHKLNRENEAVLNTEDFKDGKLSVQGYNNLKEQCHYIPFVEDIEIKVPKECKGSFRDSLENLAAVELSRIKKDLRYNNITVLILLFNGIIFMLLGNFLEFLKGNFFENIIVIASWVFIWAAVEKWFFDRRKLHAKKLGLLQILSASLVLY